MNLNQKLNKLLHDSMGAILMWTPMSGGRTMLTIPVDLLDDEQVNRYLTIKEKINLCSFAHIADIDFTDGNETFLYCDVIVGKGRK